MSEASELSIFRDMASKFFEKEVVPLHEQWHKNHLMPKEYWRVLGDAGMLLVDMPEQYGGAEASFECCQLIQEEMCRLGLHALATGYNIHANIVAPYILNIGNEQQMERWLPKMATGEVVTAIAMTEPGAGSDLAALRTTAIEQDDHYLLNGSKTFISNGIHADMVIVCAKTDPKAGAKGISLFLVDTTLEGFDKGKKIEKMGQHANDTAELFFDNVKVPKDALLGEAGKGFTYLMRELPRERLGCAIQAIGHAQGALDMAIDYVQERKAFGQSVSQFQNTRFKLADCKTQLELCRALAEKHMDKFSRGEMTVDDAAILKYSCTEMQLTVVNECLQLFGGYGYTDEYPISRFYRDARIQTIYAGTSEIMKEVIARSLVGR